MTESSVSAALAAPAAATPDWWEDEPSVLRVVSDLLAAELAQARPGRAPAQPQMLPWPRALDFVRDLGADSLELLGMGTALAEALHLERGAVDERLLARPCLDDWVAVARDSLRAGGSELTFRTSGSAGSPKRCTHLLGLLWQETIELARLLPGRRRILNLVPSHHIYGFLFTVLLPRALGISEVLDLRTATPAAVLREARDGDLVVAHPGWWEQLARLAPRFPSGVVGVSSTAPCPDPLARELADAGLRLLQVYGSSETAGVGWREEAGAAYILLPHWSRSAAPDGGGLAILADGLARALPGGGEARYPLQDKLEWEDARRFRPAGRIDGAVQVGGTNVFPSYVAEVLAMHPGVKEAAVRPMRPDEGRRLKAFVVPADASGESGHEALRGELLDWCAARLSTPERPAAISFGARLPRQASGKPADWIIDLA
jgi:4-coumarate--CoA ligase (photoactive yellow protein activation family)